MKELPTIEDLRKTLLYDPMTGEMIRYSNGKSAVGKPGKKGYCSVAVLGFRLSVHRCAYAMMTGEWPRHQVDHINGDKADNRWCNLRAATATDNARNQKRRYDNTSGTTGVYRHSNGRLWHARIHFEGQHISLGTHETKEAAIAARKAAEKVAGFHPNHGRA